MQIINIFLQASTSEGTDSISLLILVPLAIIAFFIFRNNKGEKKYPSLRIISIIYRILALIVAVVTIYAALFFYNRNYDAAKMFSAIAIIVGLIIIISLIALSESIMVFIDIEENTRKTSNAKSKE